MQQRASDESRVREKTFYIEIKSKLLFNEKDVNNHALNYNALNQGDTYHVVTLKHVTHLPFISTCINYIFKNKKLYIRRAPRYIKCCWD